MRRKLCLGAAILVASLAVPATAPRADAVWRAMHIVKLSCRGEFVDVRNIGDVPKDLSGWILHDYGKKNVFTFPKGFTLGAGKTLRIWSDGGEGGPYRYITWTTSTVWNNDGDRAVLWRRDGTMIDKRNCDDAGGP